ncbi:MAG: putative DNA-binding domain-containing protein [Methylophilus sp.]
MLEDFYRYIRGATEVVPPGYTEAGLRAYRHLVFLGASQMIEAHFPAIREQMGEPAWKALIQAFVRQSAWTSHYYGDLKDEFLAFLARETDSEHT